MPQPSCSVLALFGVPPRQRDHGKYEERRHDRRKLTIRRQARDQVAERRARERHGLRHEQERAEPLFEAVPRVDEPVRHAHEDAREGLLQHDIRELHGEDRERQAVGARGRLAAREPNVLCLDNPVPFLAAGRVSVQEDLAGNAGLGMVADDSGNTHLLKDRIAMPQQPQMCFLQPVQIAELQQTHNTQGTALMSDQPPPS